MTQNVLENVVPIVDVQQFLRTQRGFVAERLKTAKTSADRGPFLGALKMLDLLEKGMTHFSMTALPRRGSPSIPASPPESLEDLGKRLIQRLGLPPEFPLACFRDAEWCADLAKYLPAKARAIAEIGRLASDDDLALHLLEVLWGEAGTTAMVPSRAISNIPIAGPPQDTKLLPGPVAFSQPIPSLAPLKPLLSLANSAACPHCGRGFKNKGSMIAHAKACAKFHSPSSQSSMANGDPQVITVLVDHQGRTRFNGRRFRLGKSFASRQVLVRSSEQGFIFSTIEGDVIKKFSTPSMKNDSVVKPETPSVTNTMSGRSESRTVQNSRLSKGKKTTQKGLVDKHCPYCQRLFENVGAMKSHAKFCPKAIKPEKLIQLAKESIPVPGVTDHINVTAHKVAASDRPWDGETFENAGDAEHFAGDVYDEKYLHRTRPKRCAGSPSSTLGERLLAGDVLKNSVNG